MVMMNLGELLELIVLLLLLLLLLLDDTLRPLCTVSF